MTRWILGIIVLLLSTTALAATASDARAQDYPKRPVSYIVPYGPGSGNDVIARIVARKVSDNWGQPVVVVNRPGATGGIGLELTAKAQPDGHTIVIASTSQIINQHLSKVRYDFLRDFTPVSLSGSMPYAVSVLNTFPAKSLKELVALAKAQPGKFNYTGTVGSIAHFMGDMLKSAANIDIVMIPNKLAAEAEADVLGGRIEIWMATLSTTLRQARADKVRVLAVGGDKRASELPNVPTMTEAGYPRANVVADYFILAPAGTPRPIVDVLNSEIVKAIGDREVKERLVAAGVEPTSSSPQEVGARLKSEVSRWEKIVKESGIRLE
jgi:tripartite-type tricarboxylate transporter receptor subunit TctC